MKAIISSLVLAVFVLGFIAGCSPAEQEASSQPNILLILCDDMGWSDIGCYGGEIKTPNLDALAENGIRFTQFHNTSKCFPSRACLITGVYAQQCGFGTSYKNPITNAVTLGEVLQTAGYRTLWSGKHHGVENPFDRGYDRYYGLRDGACNHFNPGLQREGEGIPAQKNWKNQKFRTFAIDDSLYSPYTPPKDFYTTDYFTNYALQWLDEYKNEDKPFFLYLAYTAPHDPLMAWPEDIAKYEDYYKVGYEKIRKDRMEKQKSMGLLDERYPISDATHKPWDELTEAEKESEARVMAVYAAMVDRVDQNIGRILEKLSELDKDKNTLILFMSDNGSSSESVTLPGEGDIGTVTRWTSLLGDWANVSNAPFRYFKNYSHEGGINTPLIASWADGIVEPGRISEYLGHFIDIMPTLIDISGAEYPTTFNGQDITPYQGNSLLPVLKDESVPRAEPLFWHWRNGKALRQGKWKLVSFGKNTSWELYDMDVDRTETNDLAETHPEVLEELAGVWKAWAIENKIIEPESGQ